MTINFKRPFFWVYIFITIFIITSCNSEDGQKSGSKQAKVKQVIVNATMNDPKTFNLVVSNEQSSTTVIAPVFDGLLKIGRASCRERV